MTSTDINNTFNAFAGLRVLIIGDVMVDAYYWGKVERISPEAPVPVVAVQRHENRLGGAANVALNVKAMGATPILCAVTGQDEKGQLFQRLMEQQSLTTAGMVTSTHRQTTVKTRILGSNQQILRVDEETLDELNATEEADLLTELEKLIPTADVIIFEDYDKGVLTEKVIQQVIAWAREKGIPTAVDPKKNHFLAYQQVTLFKPNLKELREGLKLDVDPADHDSLKQAVGKLAEATNADHILVTLSERGVLIGDRNDIAVFPAHVRSIADVSGAGDTVISVAALALAQKLSPEVAARWANLAGGLVCEKVGVVPIDKAQLQEEILRLESEA